MSLLYMILTTHSSIDFNESYKNFDFIPLFSLRKFNNSYKNVNFSPFYKEEIALYLSLYYTVAKGKLLPFYNFLKGDFVMLSLIISIFVIGIALSFLKLILSITVGVFRFFFGILFLPLFIIGLILSGLATFGIPILIIVGGVWLLKSFLQN